MDADMNAHLGRCSPSSDQCICVTYATRTSRTCLLETLPANSQRPNDGLVWEARCRKLRALPNTEQSPCTFASGRICIFSPRISVQSCAVCRNLGISLAFWGALGSVLHADELDAIIPCGGNLAGSLARFSEKKSPTHFGPPVNFRIPFQHGCLQTHNPRPCCNKGSRECSGDISRTKAPGQAGSTSHLSTMLSC